MNPISYSSFQSKVQGETEERTKFMKKIAEKKLRKFAEQIRREVIHYSAKVRLGLINSCSTRYQGKVPYGIVINDVRTVLTQQFPEFRVSIIHNYDRYDGGYDFIIDWSDCNK